MRVHVTPQEATTVEICPSEQPGYVCAMLIANEYVDATLQMTTDDVKQLRAILAEYE
jgi:hypothetical protein